MGMIDDVYDQMKTSAKKAEDALKTTLSRIRTGRANSAILDTVRVDYYGTMTPVNQMASVTTPEPRLIMVKPWDRTVVQTVDKAIQAAGLGLNPMTDGEIIRIPIPQLTEERRKDLVKTARKHGEECKITIRNARRECNEMLKEIEDAGEAAGDDVARALKKIQEMTDQAVAEVDRIVSAKETDITEI
ncbi:MAG: ribosome recycling factor [Deltaproteobacteria bacterium]|nr:ribosome recycling factor [Deltaproteobacteria bacterium]